MFSLHGAGTLRSGWSGSACALLRDQSRDALGRPRPAFRPPGEPVLEVALCRWIHRVRFLPAEQQTLPGLGIGITNLVGRVTAAASELSVAELREGASQLETRVGMLRPRCVAVLGLQAYRTAFLRPEAVIGRQPELLGGALLWLLPNPSGLQARYQLPQMNEMFKSLFVATEAA